MSEYRLDLWEGRKARWWSRDPHRTRHPRRNDQQVPRSARDDNLICILWEGRQAR